MMAFWRDRLAGDQQI